MVTGRLIPFSEIQRNRSIVGIQKNPAELRHLARSTGIYDPDVQARRTRGGRGEGWRLGIQKNPAELRHLAHYDIVLLEEKRA